MWARILAWSATIATLASLILSLRTPGQPFSALQGGLIGITALFFAGLIILDVRQCLKSRPRSCKNPAETKEFMHNWISQGGRVVIFTRDMSWADDVPIRNLLFDKARGNELTICLPARISVIDDLEKEGAEIVCYDRLDYIPESRFTIINKGRMDARVAVGRKVGDRLVIEDFSLGQHPVFAVANDLVEVLRRASAPAKEAQ